MGGVCSWLISDGFIRLVREIIPVWGLICPGGLAPLARCFPRLAVNESLLA